MNVAECGEKNGRLINRGNRVAKSKNAKRERVYVLYDCRYFSAGEKRIRPTDGVTIDRSSAAIDRYPFAKRKYLMVMIDCEKVIARTKLVVVDVINLQA